MTTSVRTISLQVTFADVVLGDVLSARGEVSADGGWPTCSVFVTAKPATGNQEDGLQVIAGADNVTTRFQGRVRRFRPSSFPKSIELVAMGELAYAAEWAPSEDILFEDEFPSGATDEVLVQWALDHVPNVTYVPGDIAGTGVTLGLETPDAFDWTAGTSAWSYIQQLDQATLYRTYQDHLGAIRRVKMIGHPNDDPDFTLAPADILDGATASRDTERTRNYVEVHGYDFGGDLGAVLRTAFGSNDFQGPGDDPATRHAEKFSSSMIEDGNDQDGAPWGNAGLNAQDIADEVISDVNKEFVEAQIPSWRDDLHGPGLTCQLNALDRLAIGEPMWVVGYSWEVGDDGWTATYSLTGGGLPQSYPSPPV